MNERVLDCLYAAIDEINLERADKPPLAKALDTPIHGSDSGLDSLGLVNFVVAAEEMVEERFGVSIVLADDRSLAQEPSPFRSVRTLAEYVETLLQEAGVEAR